MEKCDICGAQTDLLIECGDCGLQCCFSCFDGDEEICIECVELNQYNEDYEDYYDDDDFEFDDEDN